ncbi:MAG: hypothetical protein KF787_07250 [Phycisphaeraceae bacterium]|nr:hypothetical protein [Phycisphaeraceae bacterium]
MREVRIQAQSPEFADRRLNLLLSYAGWQSNPWVDRLPCLLEPLGVSSVRARSGREAAEVIRSVPIHIAVVDLGLPLEAESPDSDSMDSEGGPRLLELLARLSEPPPTVVVKPPRTHRDDRRDLSAALRLGAFAVVDRPRGDGDLELMLEVLRRCLSRFYHGRWPSRGDPVE